MTSRVVYFVKDATNGEIKIGHTNDLYNRFESFKTQFTIDPACCGYTDVPRGVRSIDFERQIHAAFADRRLHGEWFALSESDVRSLTSKLGFRLVDPESIGSGKMHLCTHLRSAPSPTDGGCVACYGVPANCPKTKIKCKISPVCWRVKA